MFSTKRTCPSSRALIAASNSAPRVTPGKTTSWPNLAAKSAATGASDLPALSASSFTRPRWEKRIARPPCSMMYLIVGRAAVIRLSLVITPSFNGTLKSTRTRTFLPFKSTSLTVSFAMLQKPLYLFYSKLLYHTLEI